MAINFLNVWLKEIGWEFVPQQMLLNMIDGRLRVLMRMGQQLFHHEVVINVSCCLLTEIEIGMSIRIRIRDLGQDRKFCSPLFHCVQRLVSFCFLVKVQVWH